MGEIRSITDIEKDNARLSKLKTESRMAQERYNHTVFEDEGVLIDQSTAMSILSALAPEHMSVDCCRYYFVNDKYGAVLIGVNAENIGLFTVDMPREMADVTDDPVNLEATVEYYKTQKQLFQQVNLKGSLVLLLCAVAICLLFAVSRVFGVVAALLLFCLFAACVGILIGG